MQLTLYGFLFFLFWVPFLSTMDEKSKIKAYINTDLSIIINDTFYDNTKDFVSLNPATAANMLLRTHLKCELLQETLKDTYQTLDIVTKQLKEYNKQLHEHNTKYELHILKKEIEQAQKARKQFEQAKQQTTSYALLKKVWHYGIISLSYCAMGYGLLTLHNDACQNQSNTLLHQLVCNPWG